MGAPGNAIGGSSTPPTPLDVKKLTVIWMVYLAESLSITLLFPFIAFMVRDFHISDEETDIGYYAGWVSGSFTFCQFISSPFWGYVSDHWGRRPVLLLGLLGNTLTITMFGMCKTFALAIFARSLNGLLNGNLGVCLVYVREISDATNQAKSFASLAFVWGIGSIIGPIVGGALAEPAVKYPFLFSEGSLFGIYPYLLPCLISSIVSLIGACFGYFFLEETLKRRVVEVKTESGEAKPLLSERSLSSTNPPKSMLSTLFSLPVMLAILCNSLVGMAGVASANVFSIWAVVEPAKHGLGFTSSDISMCFCAQGVALLVWQMFVYHHVDAWLGPVNVYRISLMAMTFFFVVCPCMTVLLPADTFFWIVMMALFFFRGCAAASLFTSSSILLMNCCTDHVGTINGISASLQSMTRAAGPVVGGSALSWSQSNGLPFPFDYHFSFLMMGAISIVSVVLSFAFPKETNYRQDTINKTKEQTRKTSVRDMLQRRSSIAD
eukprot:Nk52_evm28s2496 gene=Nk52_evmTU28s2496